MNKLSRWIKKYFIPHEHNEFKPHFLRHESMLFICLVVIIIELAFLAQVFIVFNKTNFLAAVLPGILTKLTNEERAHNNVAPLTENALLKKAAELKAQDMATRGYFAHTSPDGKTPWYWLDQVGYNYSSAGENLAVNFFESAEVAEAWMDSPTHRTNIVKKNYTEIGIGVAKGSYEGHNTVFVAQFFGTPLATIAPTTPPNETNPVAPAPAPKPTVTPEPAPKPTPVIPPPAPTSVPEPVEEPTIVTVAPTTTQILGEESSETANTNLEGETAIFKSFMQNMQKALTSPRQYVSYVFLGLIILVILALIMILFVRSEMAHPAVILRGGALMAVIFFLLFVNLKVSHLQTKIPTEGLSASVIAY